MPVLFMILSMLLVDDKIADRLWESSKVVEELIKAPDADIPLDLLKKAECVAVIPGLKKARWGSAANSAGAPCHARRTAARGLLVRRR
jgi:hypothetical protein